MPELIYKICHTQDWAESRETYHGSSKDKEDGFLHFSTAAQLPGTLSRYYADAEELVLVAVKAAALGDALRYEASTGGDLFPHLYMPLPLAAVVWAKPITKGRDHTFALPPETV